MQPVPPKGDAPARQDSSPRRQACHSPVHEGNHGHSKDPTSGEGSAELSKEDDSGEQSHSSAPMRYSALRSASEHVLDEPPPPPVT